jgi:cytochrome c peroxidase
VALDRVRRIAWTDDALDGAISRVELGGAVTTRVRSLPPAASAAALEGRRTFFDATNPHLSPAGMVACATCHPDGGEDGVVWFIRAPTIPAKRRLTPHLANAGAATAPYHWDGALPDRATLVHSTVTNLMAGDGLLVDGDAVAAYLDELVQPPIPPAGDAAAIARGAEVFTTAGCASCHPPPLYTDRQRHPVAAGGVDDAATLPVADTPALHGLFLRARYLHDGRSPSLEDLTTRIDLDAHGATLDALSRADLIAYLRSL